MTRTRAWSLCPWKGLARHYTVYAAERVLAAGAHVRHRHRVTARRARSPLMRTRWLGQWTDDPVLRRLRAGQHPYQEGVVWAFPPAMSVSKGDSLGREGCSKLFSLVSDLLRGLT